MVDVVIDGPGSDTDAPLTVQKRVRLVARWLPLAGASILDGGCGAGGYVQALLDSGAIARGVEFETDKVAKWNLKNPGNDAVQHGDLQNLNFPDASFDAVLVNEVLEHVPDQDAALAEAFRVLRPGGLLFLFAPNRFHPFETHGYLKGPEGQNTGAFRTMGMPYLPESWRPRDLRAWARNYWPSELRRLVQAHGFSVTTQTYVWQTLENNSGGQSRGLKALSPYLRPIMGIAEKIPLVKTLGVSQLIVAKKLA